MRLLSIGTIRSPYQGRRDVPDHEKRRGEVSSIEIFPDFADGLQGLHRGDKIMVVYWADRSRRDVLTVKRKGQAEATGVFNSHSPDRPNPVLISEVTIEQIDGLLLQVTGLDALDGSPLIDIKPSID